MAKREVESSLELLLDTMCNTFGGVMFIAISLVVVISMLSSVKNEEYQDYENAVELQQELEKLQSDFDKINRQQQIQKELLKYLENDPRKEQISELIILEAKKKSLEIEVDILKNQENLIQFQVDTNLAKLEKLHEQQKLSSEEDIKMAQIIQSLQNELTNLQQILTNIVPKKLNFRVMESSNKAPFWIIVGQNKVWRVGPLRDSFTSPWIPISDCAYQTTADDKFKITMCMPIPDRGVTFFENSQITPAMLNILKEIPSDRVPLFVIDRESLENFCKLREYLKVKNIMHGVNILVNKDNSFHYVESNTNVEYEY